MEDNHFSQCIKNQAILKAVFTVIFFVLFFTYSLEAQNKDQSLMLYGKVETIDNTYEGFIRWGNEEAFWFEYFNASKTEINSSKQLITTREKKEDNPSWYKIDWKLSSIWEDKKSTTRHEFSCQFGNIKYLIPKSRGNVIIGLKNGSETELNGSGYNDIGATIQVNDEELGKVNIKWDRLTKVTFSSGSKSNGDVFGNSIYGTVKTFRKGDFTGYIQWDMDERLGTDRLDGDNSDGDVSIAFDKISEISKYRSGSKVILRSGREFYLTNSNDVNEQNRGILVFVEGIGEVKIPWSSFESLQLGENPQKLNGYDTYKSPKGLDAKVFLHDNNVVKGKIIYDLDETWGFETIEGNDDRIAYRIPIENIASIIPKNYNFSLLTMKSGEKILLGDGRDVTDNNDGLLVFEQDQKESVYVSWTKISEIVFE